MAGHNLKAMSSFENNFIINSGLSAVLDLKLKKIYIHVLYKTLQCTLCRFTIERAEASAFLNKVLLY